MAEIEADTSVTTDVEAQVDALDRNGFLLVRNALDKQTVLAWRDALARKYEAKEWDISNKVGNVAFDHLLTQEPELARPMVGHPSVAPYLKAMLGRQCQLRSLRAHVNPGDYTQEWHVDFGYYWDAQNEGRHALRPLCINTTFYLTDNSPEIGRLTFIPGFCHREIPVEVRGHAGYDRNNPFSQWCEQQEHVHLHPMTGDAVVFLSHVPHQGAKMAEDPTGAMRSNIVLHYQQSPMFPGIRFVSSPRAAVEALGYDGTFPFLNPSGS